MNQEALSEALAAFAATPDRPRLEHLLDQAGEFIIAQARGWKACSLPFADRCRELLTEMFLILREEFDPTRISHPRGILSFVSLRLRRLTRPPESRSTPFGLSEDLPDRGRLDFTAGRLELVEHLVRAVRRELAETGQEPIRRLEFPFLHVSPDLAAISRFFSRIESDDPVRRLEQDKKRHQAFNRSLRSRFEQIPCADWREVTQWSPGERSHLAWRIISFSAVEAQSLGEGLHQRLESWRDTPEPFATAGNDHRDLVSKALTVWGTLHTVGSAVPPAGSGLYAPTPVVVHASAEPAALYGNAGPHEEEGPLETLLFLTPSGSAKGAPLSTGQPTPPWTGKRLQIADPENEAAARDLYKNVAGEIRAWWLNLADKARTGQERGPRRERSESPCH